jgi:hypothetical protein
MKAARISYAYLVTLTATLLLAATAPQPAQASDFDGSRNLLCAPNDVVECDTAARCERASIEDVDLPSFVHVQFAKKRLASAGGGDERTTPIQNIQSVNGLTILQGAENGRAWSVVIDQTSGRMSGSIADGGGAFAIFGACLPE